MPRNQYRLSNLAPWSWSLTYILLAALSFFSLSLLALRVIATHSPMYLFLVWNLMLAMIPWLMTTGTGFHTKKMSGPARLVGMVLWILFFPNSPYILTDLFHLHKPGDMPLWFDLIMILSFATTALVFGLWSLHALETALRNTYKSWQVEIFIVCMLFASGFGVYLGRYLRFNSWDLFSMPGSLLSEILHRFTSPSAHPRTWGMTLVLGIFLNLIYALSKRIRWEA
ncbi:MAG: DUF1361 domain-containing protein [Chitinophagaceae bacterium]|nr:DUF1361 domain-containing protein [Chitinophagaceae bacterium]